MRRFYVSAADEAQRNGAELSSRTARRRARYTALFSTRLSEDEVARESYLGSRHAFDDDRARLGDEVVDIKGEVVDDEVVEVGVEKAAVVVAGHLQRVGTVERFGVLRFHDCAR